MATEIAITRAASSCTLPRARYQMRARRACVAYQRKRMPISCSAGVSVPSAGKSESLSLDMVRTVWG